MRLLHAMALIAIALPAAAAEPERDTNDRVNPDDALICQNFLDNSYCRFEMRVPSARQCSAKPDAERIACLEAVVDELAREIPRMIEREIDKRMTPRLYR
jgi:hypothetical protein